MQLCWERHQLQASWPTPERRATWYISRTSGLVPDTQAAFITCLNAVILRHGVLLKAHQRELSSRAIQVHSGLEKNVLPLLSLLARTQLWASFSLFIYQHSPVAKLESLTLRNPKDLNQALMADTASSLLRDMLI